MARTILAVAVAVTAGLLAADPPVAGGQPPAGPAAREPGAEAWGGWRVPTREELAGIFPAVDAPFTNTKYNKDPYGKGAGEWASYWTSDLDLRRADYAYVYHWYAAGGANNCTASKNFVYVRCVHDPVKK